MNNFDAIALTAAARTGLDYDTARDAAEAYARQLEIFDGRTINADDMSINDTIFITNAIQLAHGAGDFDR